LAIEVVSQDDPARDYTIKRVEDSTAKVQEYWVVDPGSHRVTLLVFNDDGSDCREAGCFIDGQTISSI
jgi:Uma2 family endonuclease